MRSSAAPSSSPASDLRPLGAAYDEVRGRIVQLVAGLDRGRQTAPVPACPDWSVRDLIAHLTGVCTDILSGNLEGSATDRWTAAQVKVRRDRDLAEILAQWDEAGSQIAAMLDDFPGWYGHQLIADITVHEHDIRGAIDRPGARDADEISIALDFAVQVIFHSALAAYGLGPLEVGLGDRRWVVGGGDSPTGDREAWRAVAESKEPEPAAGPPVGRVAADPFEFFRAVTGRRRRETDPEPRVDRRSGALPRVLRVRSLHPPPRRSDRAWVISGRENRERSAR